MNNKDFQKEMINAVHNMRFAFLRGFKADATEDDIRRRDILCSDNCEETYALLEQLAKEPHRDDEEELLQILTQWRKLVSKDSGESK